MRNKFKVWCKDKQEWEKDPIFIAEDGRLYHFSISGLMPLKPGTHIPVFYTDKHDKHGEEIYERDVVRFDILEEFTSGEPLKNMVGEIRWDASDTGFFVLNNDGSWPHVRIFFTTNIEIIGTALKNPELLEG